MDQNSLTEAEAAELREFLDSSGVFESGAAFRGTTTLSSGKEVSFDAPAAGPQGSVLNTSAGDFAPYRGPAAPAPGFGEGRAGRYGGGSVPSPQFGGGGGGGGGSGGGAPRLFGSRSAAPRDAWEKRENLSRPPMGAFSRGGPLFGGQSPS